MPDFASGFAAGAAKSNARKQAALKQQQLEQKQVQAAQKTLTNDAKTIISSFERLAEKNPEAVARVKQQFIGNAETSPLRGFASQLVEAGLDPTAFIAAFRNAGESAVTSAEAGARKTDELAGRLGREPTEAETRRDAGVAPTTELQKLIQAERAAIDAGDLKTASDIRDRITKINSVTGTTQFDPGQQDKVERRNFTALQASTRASKELLGRMRNQLASDRTFTGLSGGVIRGLSSLAGTMQQVSTSIGGQDEAGVLNPNSYSEFFKSLKIPGAADSAAFQTNMVNLAYSFVRSLQFGTGSRVARDDVENAMRAIGGRSGDKDQILASFNEIEAQMDRALENTRLAFEARAVKGLPRRLPPVGGADPITGVPSPRARPLTATNPETGEKLVFNPDTGNWEPLQ